VQRAFALVGQGYHAPTEAPFPCNRGASNGLVSGCGIVANNTNRPAAKSICAAQGRPFRSGSKMI
jgi:hypothetical protein